MYQNERVEICSIVRPKNRRTLFRPVFPLRPARFDRQWFGPREQMLRRNFERACEMEDGLERRLLLSPFDFLEKAPLDVNTMGKIGLRPAMSLPQAGHVCPEPAKVLPHLRRRHRAIGYPMTSSHEVFQQDPFVEGAEKPRQAMTASRRGRNVCASALDCCWIDRPSSHRLAS